MFEGIILLLFFITGALASLLAIFFYVIALLRKSKAMLMFGLWVTLVPLILYGIMYWYYDIHIPAMNKNQAADYAGVYYSDSDTQDTAGGSQPVKLFLHADETYEIIKDEVSDTVDKGTWRPGAEDGLFEFSNRNGQTFFGMPSNGNSIEIDHSSISNKSIVFKK